MSERFAYVVRAELPDSACVERYVAWLLGGHLAAVVEAGAASGEVVRFDGEPLVVEAHYRFASRDAFAAYEAGPAVALRGEGARWFGENGLVPGETVKLARRTGVVVHEA